MNIKEMQKEAYSIIEKWNIKNKKEHKKEIVFPHLIEEVGEFAREYNHFVSEWRQKADKERLSEELIDILIQIFNFSEDYDIDLEKTFKIKINKLKKRYGIE